MATIEKLQAAARRTFMQRWLVGGLLMPAAASGAAQVASSASGALSIFSVRAYGASGSGRVLDTKSIQAAVDACVSAKGGVVYFPPGTYLSGTIFLKSNVTLVLDRGAILLGSSNLSDYPSVQPKIRSFTDEYVHQSLLYGEDLDGVTIMGYGTIDGQGATFKDRSYRIRPYLIRMVNCTNIDVSGIHLKDSPMWVQHYLGCSDVHLHGLTVRSICNRNNDGIDIDACDRVSISDCNIASGDDSIVLKSTSGKPCRDVTVTNCVLKSLCNALKLGTESVGSFVNISISNCTIYDTNLSGLALEMVDGGVLENVNVSGLTMRNVKNAIFMRLGNRARPAYDGAPQPGMGAFRNVIVSGVQADGADKIGCPIVGLPGHPLEDVTLRDIRVKYSGGGVKADTEHEVPEKADSYPEYKIFGVLPAFGFYCRHARGLRLHDVQVSLAGPDERPALVCDDVDRLTISGFEAPESAPKPVLRNCPHTLMYGNRDSV